MEKPSICPEHGKHLVAECVKCGKLLCRDCLRRKGGKYYCKNCVETIETHKADSDGRKVGLFITIALSVILAGVGLYILTTSLLPVIRGEVIKSFTETRLTKVADALNSFKEDTGRYPTEEEGLILLLHDRTDNESPPVDDWYGPYLPLGDIDILKDNFGNSIHYGKIDDKPYIQSFGKNGERDFVPDEYKEKPEGDDIVIWLGEEVKEEKADDAPQEDLEFGKPVVKGGWW